jgi:hypothetical protein
MNLKYRLIMNNNNNNLIILFMYYYLHANLTAQGHLQSEHE